MVARKLWLVLLLVSLVPSAAVAELNIVFLDANKAILETDEAKEFTEDLEEELKPQLDSVKALNDEMEALQNRLQKEEAILSESQRQLLVSDIRAKRARRDGQLQLLQQIQQQEVQRLLEKFAPRLEEVVEDLIALESYDAVLYFNRQAVFYVNPLRDITRKATEKLNNL